jgi:hypothetical protein
MGQYLGGIDPRNNPEDTVGYINDKCVIKYDRSQFIWHTPTDNIKKPFLKVDNTFIPIFNLHIHSKKLGLFV